MSYLDLNKKTLDSPLEWATDSRKQSFVLTAKRHASRSSIIDATNELPGESPYPKTRYHATETIDAP